ncbi:MAG: type VI secretion system tip protein TssI/VgrG, partial [Myxococcales bacterium]
MATELLASLTGDRRIELRFECADDPGEWELADLILTEAISDAYTAQAEIRTQDATADPGALLGKDVVLSVGREGVERRLCGKVTHVEHGGTARSFNATALLARIVVEPALCALKQVRDTRIFQNLTVVEILDQVLAGALQAHGRNYDQALKRAYPKREYTVQYRETDYDFLMRLLAEEGISFYFDHEGEIELLTFVDDNNDFPDLVTIDHQPVPLAQTRTDIHGSEPVFTFNRADQTTTTSVVVKDFDWTKPSLDVSKEERAQDAQGLEREAYEPLELTIGNYQGEGYTENDADARARLIHERMIMQQRGFVGDGAVTAFAPGHKFELVDHPLPGFDGEYLITSVTHMAGLSGAPDEDATDRYLNRFTAIPVDVPHRPEQVTPRPRIHGVLSATVVGPAGQEIYTDEHGRIKVQFHWDRHGQRDDHSSCFIRVAQQWAGPGYGFVFIPRIGMEVIVTFMEGNADRPLVTGCVYNGENRPQYPLPDNQSRTLIRTKSFGGDGFNEIRFEDAEGAEEFFTHASKDYNEVVENDHSTDVKGKQSNTVAKSHSESVGGSQSLSVGGDRSKSVKGDETTTVDGKRTETVEKDETITVTNGNRALTLKAGNQDIKLEGGDQKVEITGNDGLEVDGDKTSHVTGTYHMTADTTLVLQQSGTTFTLDGGNAALSIESEGKIEAPGTIDVKSSDSITIEAMSEIAL